MDRRNWLDLSRKLVDQFDIDYTVSNMQAAIGEDMLSLVGEGVLNTKQYSNPFPITMSGISLGGTVGNGIAYDPNGQITRIDSSSPTSKNFTISASDVTNPRWDLLVLEYVQTGQVLVPKPSDPITNVFLNLVDDFLLKVIAGTPSGSPSYPAKGANDIILAGLKVPANATLGTQVTVDLSEREIAGMPATEVSLDTSSFSDRILDQTDTTAQAAFNDLDAELNKFFGQLLLTTHPTINSRVVITGADVLMKDGVTRSEIVQNLLSIFDGAQLEFGGVGAGNIYATDGLTVIGTFTMPSIMTGKWRWFAVAVIGGMVGSDNRIALTVDVQAATIDGTTQVLAPRATFLQGSPLGQVAVHALGGGSVSPIVKQNLVQVAIGSGSGVSAIPNFIQEPPASGTVDGTNPNFTTSQIPLSSGSIWVYVNDILIPNNEYTRVGVTVTFNAGSIPQNGQSVYFSYLVAGQSMIQAFQQFGGGVVDGLNDTFTFNGVPVNKGAVWAYVNGIISEGDTWDLLIGSTTSSVKFKPGSIPQPGQSVYIIYLIALSGNTTPGGGGGGSYAQHGDPGSPITVISASGVPIFTEDRELLFVDSAGGAQTISAVPQIASGTKQGFELVLIGTSDTDYIVLQDQPDLRLNGTMNLKKDAAIYLVYNGSYYNEISRR